MTQRLAPTPATVNAFRHALPRWYRHHRRDLPWRRTRDPYRIWVSEIMLQQTRVETVIPYYRRWLREFPTLKTLARAPASRVLKLWEGLGYYNRARNLHRAARLARPTISPSFEQLQKLPGIGRYTAAAIASIAFDERVPVVDGNVTRVLARVFLLRDNVRQPSTLQRMFSLAHELMPPRDPGEFNQAMMELGALVCTPVNPGCPVCPLRTVCRARRQNCANQFPNRGRPPKLIPVAMTAALVKRAGRVLVRRRPANGLLADLWELPACDAKLFRTRREVLTIRHTIANRRITLRVMECEPHRSWNGNGKFRWITRRESSQLAFSAAQRRAVQFAFDFVSGC